MDIIVNFMRCLLDREGNFRLGCSFCAFFICYLLRNTCCTNFYLACEYLLYCSAPFDNNIRKRKIITFDLGEKLKNKLRHVVK